MSSPCSGSSSCARTVGLPRSACKVVHVTSAHPVRDIRIFTKQCRTLAAAGYDVVLVAQHDRDELVDGVTIRAVPPARSRRERMTRTAFRAIRAAASEDASLYHLHDPELLVWAPLLRLRGGRVVFDMHENTPVGITTKGWVPAWARQGLSRIVQWAERLLLAGTPVVFAETAYGKDYPWVRRSATVLNMPLVEELLALNVTKHPIFTIGYLGLIGSQRGAGIMLDAADILASRGRRFGVELVGPIAEPFRTELARRQASATYPLCAPGYVPPRQGWERMARCHVGLAVLASTQNNRMSYPTKIFEYMALGIPVITSDFPLYRAVIEESRCGFCIDPHSPEILADKIEWLMSHPDEAAAMGERGRDETRHRFNWKPEADKLLRLYDELLPVAPGASVTRGARA
jgi:glycosyltransferase involved in cell wall biosynthesis